MYSSVKEWQCFAFRSYTRIQEVGFVWPCGFNVQWAFYFAQEGEAVPLF